jgi:hypothetical protein
VQQSKTRVSSVGITRTRPDVPPDLRGVLDEPVAHQGIEMPAELPVAFEVLGNPVRGNDDSNMRRKDCMPMSSPSQNGDEHDSASRCGTK